MVKKLGVSIGGVLLVSLALVAAASTTSALLPINDGTYTSWTPKSGASHFAMVDETPCNGTTDYNSTATVGNRDSYGVSLNSVPNAAQITQIDIKPCASRNSSGGGSSSMDVFYRLDGVDSADTGAYALSGTTPTDLATTTYSGLSTIKSAGTALQVGAVLSAGTKGARLSRVATTITYTALAAPTSLSASPISSSEIDLAWTDNSTFETNFVIERKNDTASTTYAVIATTTADVVGYSDTGLDSATKYSYRMRAYDSGGYSSYSNTASTTTP